MAISKVKWAPTFSETFKASTLDSSPQDKTFPKNKGIHHHIEEKFLNCNFYSLRPIARRQAISYYKQLKYHPNRRIYIKMINLVILHDKLLRNLFCSRICNKKSEEESE